MVNDILSSLFLWVKALHVVAVISWMAGLLYLPRLFVHHVERAAPGSETSETFKNMEQKLFNVIMRPAMIVAWLCGLIMAATPGILDYTAVWVWVKFLAVIGMTVFHVRLKKHLLEFDRDQNAKSGRYFRIMNEVPTVLMLVIVIMVIVRPF